METHLSPPVPSEASVALFPRPVLPPTAANEHRSGCACGGQVAGVPENRQTAKS